MRKTPVAPIIFNGEPIERVVCFKFLGTIIYSDLGRENNTDAVVKRLSKVCTSSAKTKVVRADERDSCSVLSFCY